MAVHFGPVLPGYKKEISITNATGYSSFSSECYLVSSTPEWDILMGLTSQRFSYERKVKVSVLNSMDLKAPEKFKARVTTQNLGNSKLNCFSD